MAIAIVIGAVQMILNSVFAARWNVPPGFLLLSNSVIWAAVITKSK